MTATVGAEYALETDVERTWSLQQDEEDEDWDGDEDWDDLEEWDEDEDEDWDDEEDEDWDDDRGHERGPKRHPEEWH